MNTLITGFFQFQGFGVKESGRDQYGRKKPVVMTLRAKYPNGVIANYVINERFHLCDEMCLSMEESLKFGCYYRARLHKGVIDNLQRNKDYK